MIDSAGIKMAQGHDIACERIESVNDNMLNLHNHDFFELYYLEHGERYHMIGDTLYSLEQGQFVLFTPYVMHHSFGEKDMPFKRIVLYFRASQVQSEQLLSALESGSGVYTVEPTKRYSIHQLLNMILQEETEESPFRKEYMHTLLNLILITIKRNVPQLEQPIKQTRISKVVDYIHTHYFESLTLEALSKEFFVSPYYLCREFKRSTNRTITQYINITRIMNAQRQIMETNKTLTKIAYETGFTNLTHFNRVFKNISGTTPSKYRKEYISQVHHRK